MNSVFLDCRLARDVEKVYFLDVTVWDKTAENCVEYLKKGDRCLVEGKLIQDRWEKDGVKRSAVKINAHNITFLNKRAKSEDKQGDTQEDTKEDIDTGEETPF